ncbi:MAG: BCD family MFS transporter [Pikeienuella sp.]
MIAAQPRAPLSWGGIVRLGLVQTALGSVVVMTNATLNRIMVVELGLAALVPGLLLGIYYALETLRPRWGYGGDRTGRRTPWILSGIALLSVSGVVAAASTWVMQSHLWAGLGLAAIAYAAIGVGVGIAGTSVLTLLATSVAPGRRAAAGAIVFLMMIGGIAVTAGVAGQFLDPFSFTRLLEVAAVVACVAVALAVFGVLGIERGRTTPPETRPQTPFLQTLAEVWADREARMLGYFVFASMLAFNMQDPILEPFAGKVFAMSVGETTTLSSIQHQGVFLGMLTAAIACSGFGIGTMRGWILAGCTLSAAALVALAGVAVQGPGAPLTAVVFTLGLGNGMFTATAIGQMFASASHAPGREGTRIGFWGAAQGIAFGLGILVGAGTADLAHLILSASGPAYASVFLIEGALFLVAAGLATRLALPSRAQARPAAALMPGE